jgi:hypothetical protein
MKNYRLARNLLLIAGLIELINTVLLLRSNLTVIVPILSALATACFFISAYTYDKKINQTNK